ncbi:dihydrodipicolinate synthase family protein, partial [Sulfurimonas sp. SAG-AH-194-I05]
MLDKIIIPTLSFFNNSEIDINSNLAYIELLNKSSIKNIILLGTTSEGVLISLSQKEQLIKLYANNLDDNINIILAPSLWSISDFQYIINLESRIKDILFLPNSYFNRKENDLSDYLKKLFLNSDKNIYLYNLPKNTLVDFTPKLVTKLLESGLNIKGIKLSHSNIDCIKNYKLINDFIVMYGSDKDINLALLNGSNYVVSQNLSASLSNSLNVDNIQECANKIRTF